MFSAVTGHGLRPVLGAIAVVIQNGKLLLVRRKKQPDAGLWGFPGGHVEAGETAMAAAAREVHEETGVVVTPLGYLDNIDVIGRGPNAELTWHYFLAAVVCQYQSGDPVAADDVSDAAWVTIEQVVAGGLPMSDHVGELALRAQRWRQDI
jgi:mutator protein MutT